MPKSQSKTNKSKKTYRTPKLTTYGTLNKLTQTKGTSRPDGNGHLKTKSGKVT